MKAYDQGSFNTADFPIKSKKKDIKSYFGLYAGSAHRLDLAQTMVVILGYITAAYCFLLPWLPLVSIVCLASIYVWQKVAILKYYRKPFLETSRVNELFTKYSFAGILPFLFIYVRKQIFDFYLRKY